MHTPEEKHLDVVLRALERKYKQGTHISWETIFSLLQNCLKRSNLPLARRLSSLISNTGFASTIFFQDHLIRLFSACGSLPEAYEVFTSVGKPTAHTWYAIISAYVKHGKAKMALKMFSKMYQTDVKVGIATLLVVLKACSMIGSFGEGRLLHAYIIEAGFNNDVTVGNTLIDVYGKCGLLDDAQIVFDALADRDLISWNTLISGYAQHGHGLVPLELFEKLQTAGLKPCKVTYSSVLKACSNGGMLGIGKHIHKQIMESEFDSDAVIGNGLIDMYAKCGMLADAQNVFDKLQNRTIVSWGSIISSYASEGQGFSAIKLFDRFLKAGIEPNRIILCHILKACSSVSERTYGMFIHDLIIRMNLEMSPPIGSALLDVYIVCGSIEDAHKVFTSVSGRNDASYNAIIAGLVHHSCYLLVLELVHLAIRDGIELCKPSLLCAIRACTGLGEMKNGLLFHVFLIETGHHLDTMIQNTLVDMYAKCGSLEDARAVFDAIEDRNLVSWGAIISGYAGHGQGRHMFDFLDQMREIGKTPNDVIYLSILRVCASMGKLEQGRLMHDQVIRAGLESASLVGNTLIHMYAMCGSVEEGRKVFDGLLGPDEVSWGVMLDGCAQNDEGFLALDLFQRMLEEGVQPNKAIFILILKSCSSTGAVQQGHVVNHQIIEAGIEADRELGTTLIDMYGQCGNLLEAHKVLNMLSSHDVSSWNALIAGYSQSGHAKLALQCFQDMQGQGFSPDGWTLTSILAACSHEGQGEKGYKVYNSMRKTHGVMPIFEHLNCLVDNLGRAGCLREAEQVLHTMPKVPNDAGWLALLTACKIFGDKELGNQCFHEAAHLDVEKPSNYMLMSSTCSNGDMWENAFEIDEQRRFVFDDISNKG